MRKRLLFLALLPLLLTGCWDRKDPEDRAFIITLGVDAEKDGYGFSFAPANIETGEAEIYTANAQTLAEAVAQVDCRTSRKTDLGQLKTVILGADVLREEQKLMAFLRELERSRTVSEKVMLLATENSAADCVDAAMKEDGKTGLFLWDFYKNTAREVAVTKGMDLDTFLTEWQEQEHCAVLPRISVEETEESVDKSEKKEASDQTKKLRLGGGMAITADTAYFLNDTEERGYLFLLGEAEGALIETAYRREVLPLAVTESRVRYVFHPLQDGRLLCTITLPLAGTLQGGEGGFLSPETHEEMKLAFEQEIREEAEHTLRRAESAGRDLFGILTRAERAGFAADWENLIFEIIPELELKDIGRRR